jgi:WS/DGAT/MGAT family acyltransferase
MQQLSGLDSAFVYLESPGMPMHIGSLAIYDQSTAPDGLVGFKSILKFFGDRLHKARCFRQRLGYVPLSFDHPYWFEDPDFDLEFHLRHIALPKPGDWRQLCIQAARLHARPLDMNKPLWEITVIEGLDNVPGIPKGSFALVSKVHHAAIDGASGAEMAAAIHELTPDAEVQPPTEPWRPDHLPSGVELLGRSAVRTLGLPMRLIKTVASNTPSVARMVMSLARRELDLQLKVPRTRFNGNVSPHRVFDGRRFDLNEVKAIRSSVDGATVNDAVVSIIGGAMRHYLSSKNELPDESLIAMAPISTRGAGQKDTAGNRVSAMSLPMRSDVSDAGERLAAVRNESIKAKKLSATLGLDLGTDAAEFLPSTVSGMLVRAYGRSGLAEKVPPIYNTVITNVPGPNVPLYSMGSRLVANFGLGPVLHGLGLFQPVLSYNGTLTISAVSCRKQMPDPAYYCECLEESFAEHLSVTRADRPRKANGRARVGKAGKKKTLAGRVPAKKTSAKKTMVKKTMAKKTIGKKSLVKKTLANKTLAKKKLKRRT